MIFVVALYADKVTCVIVSSEGVYDPDSATQLAEPCVPATGTCRLSPEAVTKVWATEATAEATRAALITISLRSEGTKNPPPEDAFDKTRCSSIGSSSRTSPSGRAGARA